MNQISLATPAAKICVALPITAMPDRKTQPESHSTNERLPDTVTLLIDIDNFFRPEYADTGLRDFSYELPRFISFALSLLHAPGTVMMRLYGGWLTNGVLTRRASILEQQLTSSALFPFRNPLNGHIVRGTVSLAKSLMLVPALQWETTFRVRAGLPRFRLADNAEIDGCVEDDSCPARLLARFTKKRDKLCHVQGCTVMHRDAFRHAEQKMVDTLIACDLLTCSNNADTKAVALFTEDTDLLPALFQAKFSSLQNRMLQRYALVVPRPSEDSLHRNDLQQAGVDYFTWRTA